MPANENPSGAIAVSTLLIVFAGLLLFLTYASVQYRIVFRRYASRMPPKLELPNPRTLSKRESASLQRSVRPKYTPPFKEPLDSDANDITAEAGIPDWFYQCDGDAHIQFGGQGPGSTSTMSFSYRRKCEEAWINVLSVLNNINPEYRRKSGESVADFLLRAGDVLGVDPEIAQLAASGHERAAYSSSPWTKSEYNAYMEYISAYQTAARRFPQRSLSMPLGDA